MLEKLLSFLHTNICIRVDQKIESYSHSLVLNMNLNNKTLFVKIYPLRDGLKLFLIITHTPRMPFRSYLKI